MRVVLFCATERGRQFFHRLLALLPDAHFDVVTFREEPWEPPFHDAITTEARRLDATVHSGTTVGAELPSEFDLLFAVSWRYKIPADVYRRAGRGAFLFHDSLLPRYRGFSPTVWAIINGEKETGATLLEMTDEIDGGPVIDQRAVAIGDDDTIATILPKVTAAYLEILEANLPRLIEGSYEPHPQDKAQATYCSRRVPDDAEIAWERTAPEIHNLIRAMTHPYTGAFTWCGKTQLKIWSSVLEAGERRYAGVAGRVVESTPDAVRILAGDGNALTVVDVTVVDATQRLKAADVLSVGTTLGR